MERASLGKTELKAPDSFVEVFLVRYSEIGLKGQKARRRMEAKLKANILEVAERRGVTANVSIGNGRLFVHEVSDRQLMIEVLSRTMGIKSFSFAYSRKCRDVKDISESAVAIYSHLLRGRKFAVRSRRAGGQHFDSRDINIAVGNALQPYSSGVDLDNPDFTVEIEVRNDQAYYILEEFNGPGGLPIGTEGRLTALVSGGIDSPVAAWMMLKRGCPVDFVFVSLSHPFDTLEFLRSVNPLLEKWVSGYTPRINIVDGGRIVEAMIVDGRSRYPNVTYKRILYTIAERIAGLSNSCGIVTGESIGQVSSQTPENLRAIQSGISIPVHRPLIGFDKDEITLKAREIGTFPETSLGEFCELFATNITLNAPSEMIDSDMEAIDFIDDLISRRLVLKPSEIPAFTHSIMKSVYSDFKDDGESTIVVDLRSQDKYDEWHYPNARRVGLSKLREYLSACDKGKTVLFYCQKGLQSAYAASMATKMGYRAIFTTADKLRNRL
ncbi:MAG TPA: tRNA uracil 4-sulfurtransferase ThiI [Thermoplasmataceae archaeon]|nr:tRNA uracil 4-sulfurtransferase ThiI [Thermoplasmataceae archaeon]